MPTSKKIEKESATVNSAVITDDKQFFKDGDRVSFRGLRKWSWNLAWDKGYGGKFFLIFLILIGIGLVTGFVDSIITTALGFADGDLSFNFFSSLASLIIGVGVVGFSLSIARGTESNLTHFWKSITWNRIRKFILVLLLWCAFGVVIGLLCGLFSFNVVVMCIWLLIVFVGTIYLFVRFQFYRFAIVNDGMGPIDALLYSRNITKGHFWECFGLVLYFGLLYNLLGFLCLIVGMVWTVTMGNIAMAKYYSLLSKNSK